MFAVLVSSGQAQVRAFLPGGRIPRTPISELVANFGRLMSTIAFLILVPAPLLLAQTPQSAAQDQSGHQAQARSVKVFASDAGLVLNFVKPDKAADFEAVMGKLREALLKSDKPERRQQAAS